VLDRVRSESEVEQLPPRHHAMLARRERRHRLVDAARRTFGAHFAQNVCLDRHAAMVAAPALRITTQL
jgi:hypothetical protein